MKDQRLWDALLFSPSGLLAIVLLLLIDEAYTVYIVYDDAPG